MTTESAWPTFMYDMQRTGRTPEVVTSPLHMLWKTRVADMYLWASPVIADHTVYISASSGLYALRSDDGSVLWHVPDIMLHSKASPTLYKKLLFVCGAQDISAVDRFTGEIVWRFTSEKLISQCTPALSIETHTVIFGSGNGTIYALDIDTGTPTWQYATSRPIRFSPSILGTTLFLGTPERICLALDVEHGERKWQVDVQGLTTNKTACIFDTSIVIAVEKRGILALDCDTGTQRWCYTTQNGPFTAPCLCDSTVYFTDQHLYAIDASNGEGIWQSPFRASFTNSAPIVSGNTIYIGGGHSKYLYAFDRGTGEKIWEYAMPEIVFSTPAIADTKLFIGCHDGYLYCFGSE